MLDQEFIQQAAAQLDNAERSREQVGQFSLAHPQITIEDAYASLGGAENKERTQAGGAQDWPDLSGHAGFIKYFRTRLRRVA
jgi:2-keto-4-pentenoate hydratase